MSPHNLHAEKNVSIEFLVSYQSSNIQISFDLSSVQIPENKIDGNGFSHLLTCSHLYLE